MCQMLHVIDFECHVSLEQWFGNVDRTLEIQQYVHSLHLELKIFEWHSIYDNITVETLRKCTYAIIF